MSEVPNEIEIAGTTPQGRPRVLFVMREQPSQIRLTIFSKGTPVAISVPVHELDAAVARLFPYRSAQKPAGA